MATRCLHRAILIQRYRHCDSPAAAAIVGIIGHMDFFFCAIRYIVRMIRAVPQLNENRFGDALGNVDKPFKAISGLVIVECLDQCIFIDLVSMGSFLIGDGFLDAVVDILHCDFVCIIELADIVAVGNVLRLTHTVGRICVITLGITPVVAIGRSTGCYDASGHIASIRRSNRHRFDVSAIDYCTVVVLTDNTADDLPAIETSSLYIIT